MEDIKFDDIKSLARNWVLLLVWFIIFLFIIQTTGIVVHEFGHYSVGKIYGCESLKISIAPFSFKDSVSNVSGWETCKFPLVMNKDGTRVCNYQTNIDSFAGLFFTLIIFLPLIFLINYFLKKKVKKYFLEGKYLVLLLIFVISMAIGSASYDLFKIGECLFNTHIGDILFRIINLLPKLMDLLIIFFFCIDLMTIVSFILSLKSKHKNRKIYKNNSI